MGMYKQQMLFSLNKTQPGKVINCRPRVLAVNLLPCGCTCLRYILLTVGQ